MRVAVVYFRMCKVIRCFIAITLLLSNIVKLQCFKANPTIITANRRLYCFYFFFYSLSCLSSYCFMFFVGMEIDIMELITSMNIMEILNARLKSFSQKVFTYLLKPMLKFQKLVTVSTNHFSSRDIRVDTWDAVINWSFI